MMAKASAPLAFVNWNVMDWQLVEQQVKQLQMRIAKATRENRYGKVKALQWLLTHSYYAKVLAVKRVTQNKGCKTPGIDGIVWRSQNQKLKAVYKLGRRGYKSKPLRRVYIAKSDGKQRGLGIPSMQCRAMQALYLLGLEPVAESIADSHAYGFRPKRSCADAIEQCFRVLVNRNRAQWVLEGDIKSCFDMINHKWLLENTPMDKVILSKWLKAGYIHNGELNPTNSGTPQGGIISPTLLTITLAGLTKAVKAAVKQSDKVNVVTYADDFIITGNSKEILEQKVKPVVEEFLSKRGLLLSETKTVITHINSGFDFLGFNIRKYNGKLLTKPSKKSVSSFLSRIRTTIKENGTARTENLIYLLNPKIRGWVNYFRYGVSSKTFASIDHNIFEAIRSWARRRHPKKSQEWRDKRYFCALEYDNWVFNAGMKLIGGRYKLVMLFKAHLTKIVRHIKIKAEANPYDPKYTNYFAERELRRSKLKLSM